MSESVKQIVEENTVNESTALTVETTNLEDVKIEEVKQKKLMNLSTILGGLLLEESKLSEVRVKLNLRPEYLILLKRICELSPELLDEIDDSIADIVADKVIDSSDVPKLIVLVKNVYKNFSDSKKLKSIGNITLEDSINFIKNLILLLIELDHIKVNDKDNIVLIIDLCVDLLTTSIDVSDSLIDKIKGCFKC